MSFEKVVTKGTLIAALAGGFGAVAEAAEEERKRLHPQGWKVAVASSPLLPKQGLYTFTVTVKDEGGERVENAEVYLRIPQPGKPGYRLHPVKSEGRGRYHTSAIVWQGEASRVKAVVRPAGR